MINNRHSKQHRSIDAINSNFRIFHVRLRRKMQKNRDNDQQITQSISKNKKSKKLNRIRQCQNLKKKHSFVK